MEKEKIHENIIYNYNEFNNKKIIDSGSGDKLIKLWSD